MKDKSAYETVRQSLFQSMRREIFGPTPDDPPADQNEVLGEPPIQLYGTGILFPQKVKQEYVEDTEDNGTTESPRAENESPEELDSPIIKKQNRGKGREEPEEEEPLNLANQYCPSALGVTFKVKGRPSLNVLVTFGTYQKGIVQIPHPHAGSTSPDGVPYPETLDVKRYTRIPHTEPITLPLDFSASNSRDGVEIPNTEKKLRLHPILRETKDGESTVSLMLVNHQQGDSGYASSEKAFFQIEFEVTTQDHQRIFCPVEQPSTGSTNEEIASLNLLYRDQKVFSHGHGCAGDWNRDEETKRAGLTDQIRTAVLPQYEVHPVRPREKSFSGTPLRLQMGLLAGAIHGSDSEEALKDIIPALTEFCDDYATWIASLQKVSAQLPTSCQGTAQRHITACRTALNRMRKGIEVLADPQDPAPLAAFRIANQAMLMQQIHTSIKSRDPGSEFPPIPNDYAASGSQRQWRPFQLGFILMNLAGGADPNHDDRKIADLIWFPTGGGKTEAYLGVAAYIIALRRLRSPENAGTTVLMRYTLRLLTAQQFQRASALTTSLESLRKGQWLGFNLGTEPITIGLWVGKSLSPNKRSEALARLSDLKRNPKSSNPFQVLNCPWCGCAMNHHGNLGYVETRLPGSTQKTVEMHCPDERCPWGQKGEKLPILVIDEDIYQSPPTLLLGTVDKFAQISWKDEAGKLFGIGSCFSPPELIIQDELHLISGPLGSIVGLYEAAIDRICTRPDPPKVIASTATIRNAAEQCKALFNRQSFEFPPQGLKANDSYFAEEDTGAPGRLYVGVFGSGFNSHATSLVRTCAALLQGVMPTPPPKDTQGNLPEIPTGTVFEAANPYGTLVWYFNSLRELGQAATMCTGHIPEHLKSLCRRGQLPWPYRRKIYEYVELTSRRTADEIPAILKQLEIPWSPRPASPYPVDVLLATNMISVGVDIDRLGLMVVTGQPKSTSEYIQATSRVGRKFPGMVVVNYNQGKSRDRSHYEQFIAYHQGFYRFVEATSITPFSSPARERGLKGLLVALARIIEGVSSPTDISSHHDEMITEINTLIERITLIDEQEAETAESELLEALNDWKRYCPNTYGNMAGNTDTVALMTPYGKNVAQEKAWPVLTSMRNVDGTARAKILWDYPDPQDA